MNGSLSKSRIEKTEKPMDEMKHSHYRDTIHHAHRPYWKRAHRDWRFWVAVLFIFAALTIFVVSDDLALVPRS